MNKTQDAAPVLPDEAETAAVGAVESALRAFEQQERARLGLPTTRREQWAEPPQKMFTREQRATTTIIVTGLTLAHDTFLQAGLRGIGYNVITQDCPDNEALQIGKEFGNRGQCNPAYYTVGNLIRFLKHQHETENLSKSDIIDNYLLFTVSGCGPCRYGMYGSEFRKALRDSGFEGFRVLAASQMEGAGQSVGAGDGIEVNNTFYLSIMKALILGDIHNILMYRIRPYELIPGATNLAIQRCKALIIEALEHRKPIIPALWKMRKELAAIKVDRSRIRPKVSFIGEIWAMTTEGDGNYRLQEFLEKEGAEVEVQLMTKWLLYLNWELRFDTKKRAVLRGEDRNGSGLEGVNVRSRLIGTWLFDKLMRSAFYGFAWVAGLKGFRLPDVDKVAQATQPYYDIEQRGGETHTEVGKLLFNALNRSSNMTISVKPFGCMPSSGVSDGVQSKITELFPNLIFLPIETNGEGAVSVHSRVQMQLFRAKQAAQKECQEALERHGVSEAQVKRYLQSHPKMNHPLHHSPHHAACSAADVYHEVGRRLA